MAGATEEPPEAVRLEHIAEAGVGADNSDHAAKLSGHDSSSHGSKISSPAASSEAVAEDLEKEGKKVDAPEAPQRGKLKTVLIMFSLCVGQSFWSAIDLQLIKPKNRLLFSLQL